MEDGTKNLLIEEIQNEILGLNSLSLGSQEHSEAIDNLAKLYRLKIEENKIEWDADDKYERRIMEKEQYDQDMKMKEDQIKNDAVKSSQEDDLRRAQLEEAKYERYFKYGVEAGLGLITLMFYRSWMKKGFKFEETGTFTSKTFLGLIQKFRPTRK